MMLMKIKIKLHQGKGKEKNKCLLKIIKLKNNISVRILVKIFHLKNHKEIEKIYFNNKQATYPKNLDQKVEFLKIIENLVGMFPRNSVPKMQFLMMITVNIFLKNLVQKEEYQIKIEIN